MPELDEWIQDQLKRGYSGEQIKKALKKTKHPPEDIEMVDTLDSSISLAEETHKKFKNMVSIILLVIIVSGVLIWAVNTFFLTSEQPVALEAEIPSIEEFGVTIFYGQCEEFAGSDYKISCNEAASIALGDTPGTIEKISIGPKRIRKPIDGRPTFIEMTVWLIDVKLGDPYFDEILGREVKFLRIGIGLDEGIGIHKSVLEQ